MQELDRWEERLEELFAGRPYDIYDAALTATISNFPVSIQPFRDMVSRSLLSSLAIVCSAHYQLLRRIVVTSDRHSGAADLLSPCAVGCHRNMEQSESDLIW